MALVGAKSMRSDIQLAFQANIVTMPTTFVGSLSGNTMYYVPHQEMQDISGPFY